MTTVSLFSCENYAEHSRPQEVFQIYPYTNKYNHTKIQLSITYVKITCDQM